MYGLQKKRGGCARAAKGDITISGWVARSWCISSKSTCGSSRLRSRFWKVKRRPSTRCSGGYAKRAYPQRTRFYQEPLLNPTELSLKAYHPRCTHRACSPRKLVESFKKFALRFLGASHANRSPLTTVLLYHLSLALITSCVFDNPTHRTYTRHRDCSDHSHSFEFRCTT